MKEVSVPERFPDDTLHAKFPFRGGIVRLQASPSAMRADFVREAVKQGVDESRARDFIAGTTIFLEGFSDSSGRKSEPLYKDELYNAVANLNRSTNGIVYDNKHVALFFDKLIQELDKGTVLKRPVGRKHKPVSDIEEIYNLAWSHERQHLIQHSDPKKERLLRRKDKIKRRGLIGVIIASGSVPYIEMATDNYNPNVLAASMLILVAAGLGKYISDKKDPLVNSASEREAYRKENANSKIFHVTYEK